MDDITHIFIHGLDSSSQGTKGSYFRKRYPEMMVGDYQGTLNERMSKLSEYIGSKDNIIIVGSSFGGLMAAIFACENEKRVRRLVLLAPALAYADFHARCREPLQMPVTLYQGSEDTVVLPEPTCEVAQSIFRNLDYRLVKDDHSLLATFPAIEWDNLLEIRRS
ncbi:MAG: alpha/beta fold hydrolase [Syntrophales bacterium]